MLPDYPYGLPVLCLIFHTDEQSMGGYSFQTDSFLHFTLLILTSDTFPVIISPQRGYMSFQPKDTKERILHRLKISRGHLDKVISMVNSDTYCIDVIHQSQAVQKALKEVDHVILENHLKSCVADAVTKGHRDEAVSEVMQVFKKSSS
jgi:DNA-binding FrmR family transcriptional regulator